MHSRIVTTALALALVIMTGTGTSAWAGGIKPISPKTVLLSTGIAETQEKRLYIVQMKGLPAATFMAREEERAGTERRKAIRKGGRFDINDSRVRQHVSKLKNRRNELLTYLNATQDVVHEYDYAFNGMAVMLTPNQAEKLRYRRGVKNVWEDEQRVVMSGDSAGFLGLLDGSTGLHKSLDLKGEDIIVGVIDSGIAPGHPSFSDREPAADRDIPGLCDNSWARASLLGRWLCGKYFRDGKQLYGDVPTRWQGDCETGEGFDSDDCNNKLIGARFFRKGFVASGKTDPDEFISPADADGHGTHVASLLAGNERSKVEVLGKSAGPVRGIAPRARVAVYKACWLREDATRATCSVADLMRAINTAVADGVDIINYSIGSLDYSLLDPDDLALLAASDAGILTAVSAGNDGDHDFLTRGTIESPGATPWVITAGASSRPGGRIAPGIQVNSPESLAGTLESREASFTVKLSSGDAVTEDLVLVNDGDNTTDDGDVKGSVNDGCTAFTNADDVKDKIAFIQRGNCNFDVKIDNAADAEAIAVVVFSNSEELLVMSGEDDKGTIPAVMIGQSDGELLRDQLREDKIINVTLDSSTTVRFDSDDNFVADFSARGPDPDFLKPDVIAPGKSILGGHTPKVANGFQGEEYQYLTGTSQSAPIVAGLAALVKEAHPDWTPAEIKSAIMTTARQDITLSSGAEADAFDIGAGHIVPNNTIDPGLVYDVTTDDYDEYLCRVDINIASRETNCEPLLARNKILRSSDLNLPSIQINDLVAERTVTRRVRNAGAATTFRAKINAPDGVSVDVNPRQLVMGRDEEAEYTIRFESDGNTLENWLFGDITWKSATHNVYSPFSVISGYFEVPDLLSSSLATDSLTLPVQFGYNGRYRARNTGLIAPCVFPLNDTNGIDCTGTGTARVKQDPQRSYELTLPARASRGVTRFEFTLDPDQLHLCIALFDKLTDSATKDDLGLYVWKCGDPNFNQVFVNEGDDTSGIVLEEGDEIVMAENFSCTVDGAWLVGASDNAGTANEVIDIPFATAGYYFVDVHGQDVDADGVPGSNFNMLAWTFGDEQEVDNLSVSGAPGSATSGSTTDLSVGWSSLENGLFLGGVIHSNSDSGVLDYTLIEVDAADLFGTDP